MTREVTLTIESSELLHSEVVPSLAGLPVSTVFALARVWIATNSTCLDSCGILTGTTAIWTSKTDPLHMHTHVRSNLALSRSPTWPCCRIFPPGVEPQYPESVPPDVKQWLGPATSSDFESARLSYWDADRATGPVSRRVQPFRGCCSELEGKGWTVTRSMIPWWVQIGPPQPPKTSHVGPICLYTWIF